MLEIAVWSEIKPDGKVVYTIVFMLNQRYLESGTVTLPWPKMFKGDAEDDTLFTPFLKAMNTVIGPGYHIIPTIVVSDMKTVIHALRGESLGFENGEIFKECIKAKEQFKDIQFVWMDGSIAEEESKNMETQLNKN